MSTIVKYWREEVCLNFTQDSVIKKCKQLEQRLNKSRTSDMPLESDDDSKVNPQKANKKGTSEYLREREWMQQEQDKYKQSKN
jgi:hypothetical protein